MKKKDRLRLKKMISHEMMSLLDVHMKLFDLHTRQIRIINNYLARNK